MSCLSNNKVWWQPHRCSRLLLLMFVTHMMGFHISTQLVWKGRGPTLNCPGQSNKEEEKNGEREQRVGGGGTDGLIRVSCALCLIWTPREREEERERKMKIGRGADLRRISHSGSYSTVELLASPSGLHRCFSIVVQIPSRILLVVHCC